MKFNGKIMTGVLRGRSLIDIYYPRIVGSLGFEPFKGTMNVKLEKAVDISIFSPKSIEHVLMDGKKMVYAYLAPIIFSPKKAPEEYHCWAMKEPSDPVKDTIEIIAKDNLREKFSLEDNDDVEITFTEPPKAKRKVPGMGIIAKLYGVEQQVMKS